MLKPKYTFENLGETNPVNDNSMTKKEMIDLPDTELSMDEAEANLLSDLSKQIEKMDKSPKHNISDEKFEPTSYNKRKPS